MALSRLKPGFESRWGQTSERGRAFLCGLALLVLGALSCQSKAERSMQQGHLHAQKRQWAEARTAYLGAAKESAQPAHAEALAGLASLELGELDPAAEAFTRALSSDPTEVMAKYGQAQVALERHDAGAALEWLETATGATASILKARALLARGGAADPTAALSEAQAALTADANSTEARYLEGSALLALTRYAEAQASFEALEKTSRTSPLGPYGLARLAAAQQRPTDVFLYLKAARTASGEAWKPQVVAADPAFAFLVGSPAFTEAVGP